LARAATIFQALNGTYVAWEAEDISLIANSPPTQWVATNDATANGNRALYAAGANQTASPASFASFAIRFRTAGVYSFYLRWRADKAFTDLDPNSGNSYYRPNDFGDLGPDVSNYGNSGINNSRQPPDANNYAVSTESQVYVVTQEQVDAGAPVVFKIGTREAGLFLDRFVLSLNPLTESEFNALANSDTDTIVQGASETFVAFEAERVSALTNTPPTQWAVTNDAPGSGGQALYAAGVNQTASPASFATYAIRFRTAGVYSFYLRWRADKAFTDLDPNSGNSYYRPNDFGDLGPDVSNYGNSGINNSRQPPDVNNYAVSTESQVYVVTQEQVDAGAPLTFKIGTREAGLFLDRFAFSLNPLTEAEFNALPNSGSIARPTIVRAVGSASLTNVTVTFDRPLDSNSVAPANFTLSGGVSVTDATLDLITFKDVRLGTSLQAQGSNYVVTVNGVTDVSSNAISPNSTVGFTAWKIVSNWITRELYYNVVGTTVGELQAAPNFPNSPSAVNFVRTVSLGSDLQLGNYGARFRGFFIPPQSGNYEFYLYADDDALLSLSPGESAGNLAPVLPSAPGLTTFDPSAMYTANGLIAGQRYLFEVLYQQSAAAAVVGLGARRQGTPGNVADIPLLGGDLVATFVNPDAGAVSFVQHPASATIPSGQRARLTVRATAPKGGLLFYQWQVNGANIPGATRPQYVTPILSAADNDKKYRCVVGNEGTDVASQEATITVGPAQHIPLRPYVGINFAEGGDAGTTVGAALAPGDISGAVLQGNFNNVIGLTIDGTQVLVDGDGAVTPVTITAWDPTNAVPAPVNARIGTGTGSATAESIMMQGSIANGFNQLSLMLSNVPPGTYGLIVYSVGFSFNSTYEEDMSLVGAATYPTLTVRGQRSTDFIANPALVRMSSTNPANRDTGNYAMFENVSPAADGTLLLTVTPVSTNVGNTAYFPPVNALQLVTFVPPPPALSVAFQGANLTISWGNDAAGYILESSGVLGTGAAWGIVSGSPNPITSAGSINVNSTLTNQRFYRLKQ
jgi:hypothetical protein